MAIKIIVLLILLKFKFSIKKDSSASFEPFYHYVHVSFLQIHR
jgi:hypothetical protein